ncbi:hypothetical protein CBS115989_6930 [Aspergillus niger]|uniref:Uncharacterized protein n=1 Tax=Aspergillus niger ATCC 13496 TaxID=1353008 RepID=A0A370BY03_ASPNG|nr:hypothetical protein ANI_1_426054 [Aspergillus niger CBS 513.88]KAI2816291.1 hypothetical protein CBS115989_6930 [Aspergillus niger]KAI2850103.1 hypothetical protein CBS11232_6375 [Aspergillus niger]KAI2873370.1 hypothetical protein CBS115988_7098 [Aspergillus niger]RDH19288.1 hypothetical protein M747DRAFT_342482 [Aspergillus niger ATCC 13496]|eukprot:XP_001390902.2 hypothetical protein ANI_1_426054 [Aspergillus niger CBS 513.88]
MESVTESRDRYNLRRALTLLERDLSILEDKGYYTLDQTLLKRYRVQIEPLSFRGNDSLAPKYFGPFIPQGLPEPTQEYVDRNYNTARLTLSSEFGRLIYIYLQSYIRKLMIEFPTIRRVWSSNQVGDYDFGNLYRTFEPEFGTLSIFHVAKAARPHIKCIMHNDLDADDSHLLYGEVLTVVRIILGQLKQKAFVNDMVAPVLLFSLNRRRPRVIEAYYDGEKLVMRHTKPYDFTTLDKAEFKTFAQWFLGDPIGDTSKRAVRA